MGQEASVIAICSSKQLGTIENETFQIVFSLISVRWKTFFFHNEVTFILAYHCMKNEDSFITLEYHTVFMTFFSCCFYSPPFCDNLYNWDLCGLGQKKKVVRRQAYIFEQTGINQIIYCCFQVREPQQHKRLNAA